MERIGPYEILRELGRGGAGAVYAAVHPETGRQVAIKVLSLRGEADSKQRRRFMREARALAQIEHPNIVRLQDVGEQAGEPYIVLDLHSEGTLAAALEADGPLQPFLAVNLGAGLASGLAAAHAQGILHRDLKPENVLLTDSGNPILTDFGLAKDLTRELETLNLTQPGGLIGTPGFWAPEQISGEPDACGPHTDVYGLGATLYAALTGHPPAVGKTLVETLVATASVPPASIRAISPGVSADLESVVLRCLEKRPEDRWPDVGDVRTALLNLSPVETGAGPRAPGPDPDPGLGPSQPEGTRLWRLGLAAVLVLTGVALGILTAWALSDDRAPDPNLGAHTAIPDSPAPADIDSAQALFDEGVRLEKGKRDFTTLSRAADCFLRAAELKHPEAMFRYGQALYFGRGIAQNRVASVPWFRRAAALGSTRAQYMFGTILVRGEVVAKAPATGIAWLTKSATAGDGLAMYNLGQLFLRGQDCERDPDAALRWFRKSATKGHVEAKFSLALMLRKGDGTTPDPVRALGWYREAAASGHLKSMVNLGVMLTNGSGTEQDLPAAARWYRKAAEGGQRQAMHNLASVLERGEGVTRDPAAVARWYRKAAEQGLPMAMYSLSLLLRHGTGVERDEGASLVWCRKAADLGLPPAMQSLAGLLATGSGGAPHDPQEAAQWYRKALEKGTPEIKQMAREGLRALNPGGGE